MDWWVGGLAQPGLLLGLSWTWLHGSFVLMLMHHCDRLQDKCSKLHGGWQVKYHMYLPGSFGVTTQVAVVVLLDVGITVV